MIKLEDGMAAAGFSNATPLALEISAGPEEVVGVDGETSLHFSEEGAIFGARATCDAIQWDEDFPFQGGYTDAPACHAAQSPAGGARRSSQTLSTRKRRSTRHRRSEQFAEKMPFRVEHPDLAPYRVKCFFRDSAYWLRDFGSDDSGSGHVYLKLKSKTMREAVKMHERDIFILGGVVVEVVKIQHRKTKVVWDGRSHAGFVPSENHNPGEDKEGKDPVEAKVSAADISLNMAGGDKDDAASSVQRPRGGSILKKAGSPERPKSGRKKVAFVQSALADTKVSESELEKQVIDEIIECEELHVKILQGPGDLEGRLFKLVGDGMIRFGTHEDSTVVFPRKIQEIIDGHIDQNFS